MEVAAVDTMETNKNIKSPQTRGPFYWSELTLIPAWISKHTLRKVWDEITYPFPNFNGCTIEVWG